MNLHLSRFLPVEHVYLCNADPRGPKRVNGTAELLTISILFSFLPMTQHEGGEEVGDTVLYSIYFLSLAFDFIKKISRFKRIKTNVASISQFKKKKSSLYMMSFNELSMLRKFIRYLFVKTHSIHTNSKVI